MKSTIRSRKTLPGSVAGSFHRSKALIIDDEADIYYLLSHILNQKNIQTVFAPTLSDAEKIIQSSDSFVFIFLDNHLPDGEGITHIPWIKNKCPESRLIMITADDNDTHRKKAKTEGVDFFIGKPFSKETILKSVEAL